MKICCAYSQNTTITQIVSRRLNTAVHAVCVVRISRVFCTLHNIVVFVCYICMHPKTTKTTSTYTLMCCAAAVTTKRRHIIIISE